MKLQCKRCGATSTTKDFDLPCYFFNFLEGKPAICEKCFAYCLGITDAEWDKGLKYIIEEPNA